MEGMVLFMKNVINEKYFRRYTRKEIVALATECGFDVLYCNYFMQFLYLPILIVRVFLEKVGILKKRDQRTKEEQEKIAEAQYREKSGIVGCVLHYFEKHEMKKISGNKNIPYGSSIMLILKKAED
jgi:hypothetical protein